MAPPSDPGSVGFAEKEALPVDWRVTWRPFTMDHMIVWFRNVWMPHRDDEAPPRVGLFSLLSFSTPRERCYMVFGVLMAMLSGLGLPAWLVLLARALDKISNLARLISSGADVYDYLMTELNKLVLGFAVVGVVSLVTGSLYVAIWTFTGEQQALRIKESYVRSALRQDAAWFDMHDRESLPTKIGGAMVHIQASIGRQFADVIMMAVSATGSLFVALALNTPLALVMLCVVPIVVLVILIFSCFTRKSSQQAADALSEAGTLSTEVIFGIKTVASLSAQKWALDKYEEKLQDSQRFSIRSGFLSGLLIGLTGCLFYCTYTIAFVIGKSSGHRRRSHWLICLTL
jgi:ATP-binding cassette subfamily B (MDR/TAP) protein 1